MGKLSGLRQKRPHRQKNKNTEQPEVPGAKVHDT